ncbi:MAG TPA: AAA family ATPase [Candidatus Saccharimonadales bacterium]|nr:AAA family ATPase [Candidatus Saccharimonadales bacterium]
MVSHEEGLHEGGTPLDIVDRPLIVYKVGVLGCAPLEFFDTLADQYGMGFVSSDEIRSELMQEQAGPVRMNKIWARVAKETAANLADGKDTAVDMFFNALKSRRQPQRLAKEAGGLSMALWINTPYRLAKNRVEQWTEEDAFVVPVRQWDIPPVQATKTMINHIVGPANGEADYVFKLNGDTDTDGLLEQFDEQMAAHGLLDEE